MKRHTHLGVYGIIIKDNEVLLIQKARGPHTGKWDLPGGSIEFGEEPYEALKREIEEEAGITGIVGKIRTAISYTLIYPYTKNQLEELHHIGIIYDVDVLDNRYDLRANGDGQDSLGARWIAIDELSELDVTPFVAELFRARGESVG